MEAPIITIFVRHVADCKYQGDEFWKRCSCRKHLRWTYKGQQHRKKAGTRSWAEAEDVKRRLEAQYEGKPAVAESEHQNLDRAVELFLASKTSQGVDGQVVKKYERPFSAFGSRPPRADEVALQASRTA